MTLLSEISETVASAVEAARASVVTIGRDGRGAGVVVADGKVLTNAHNLRDRSTQVSFADGRVEQGVVAAADPDGDLAVLDVDTTGAKAIAWTDAHAPGLGGVVVALARVPNGGIRATWGTISAVDQHFRGPRGRRVSGAFEHTAPLGRGSSGGPVVDARGRLLGVNTHRLGRGFYLALPADAALRARVDGLSRGQTASGPRLGVGLAPSLVANRLRRSVGLPEREGLLVQVVEEDSAADRAGIRPGDLLVAVGGAGLPTVDELLDAVDAAGAGGTIELSIVRGVEERTVAVPLEDASREGGRE